jgi:hypothetical protein
MDRINNYKGESQLVLDPFVVKTDWFQLDLATLFVRPNPSLQKLVHDRVVTTIRVLKLNLDDQLVQLRFDAYNSYLRGDWSLDYLQTWYPFIAHEVIRQAPKPTA